MVKQPDAFDFNIPDGVSPDEGELLGSVLYDMMTCRVEQDTLRKQNDENHRRIQELEDKKSQLKRTADGILTKYDRH